MLSAICLALATMANQEMFGPQCGYMPVCLSLSRLYKKMQGSDAGQENLHRKYVCVQIHHNCCHVQVSSAHLTLSTALTCLPRTRCCLSAILMALFFCALSRRPDLAVGSSVLASLPLDIDLQQPCAS